MKTRINKREPVSHTIQHKTKAANQAPLSKILQAYKERSALTSTTVQREAMEEDEEPFQRQKTENKTGLPDDLKAGVEAMSGYSMDDVRVHYNSDKPAQLQALAYTQGTDIHVGPGQEKHLPHEAWHVVQQKQGRVKPTVQMQGVQVNDEVGLEKEADVKGNICCQLLKKSSITSYNLLSFSDINSPLEPIQRVGVNSNSLTLNLYQNVAKAPSGFSVSRYSDACTSIHKISIDDIPVSNGTIVGGSNKGARVDKQGEFDRDDKRWLNIQVQASDEVDDLTYPHGTSNNQKGTSFAEVHLDKRIKDCDKEDVRNRGTRLLKKGLLLSRGDRNTYPRNSYRITF